MKKFYLFEEEEYRNRWQKCQQEMEKEGIDVLVLSQLNNFYSLNIFSNNSIESLYSPSEPQDLISVR